MDWCLKWGVEMEKVERPMMEPLGDVQLKEEAYELIDSIDAEDDEGMIGELGDVLLQVMLHAQIGEDEGMFTIDDVIEGITAKMVRRHPHSNQLEESEATLDESNWYRSPN